MDNTNDEIIKRRKYSEEILKTFNLARLVRELSTREQGVAFAEEYGLILKTRLCRSHQKPMIIAMSTNKTVGSFICGKRICRAKITVSRAEGTWFGNAKLELPHIYYLVYCFAHKWPYSQVIHEDIHRSVKNTCLSEATISDWYSYCREAVVIYQLDKLESQNSVKIGGLGKVVQIDESRFGKRKFNKGQQVEGQWLLGFIEDGSEDLRIEVCPNDVSAETLVPIIEKHVTRGTIIHTDTWRAYDCLGKHGFIHKKVNRNDPENPSDISSYHGQRSDWRVVRRFFYKDSYNQSENFSDYIVEYMWRRSVEKYKIDPFMEIIKVIKGVYDPYKK